MPLHATPQVQEAVVGAGAQAHMPELAFNAASIQLASLHYEIAEQQYAAAGRRFSGATNPRLLLHLARTQYHSNQVCTSNDCWQAGQWRAGMPTRPYCAWQQLSLHIAF